MTVRCPAKINTYLSVGSVDSVGFHPIYTVFQAVALFDDLTIERSDADEFACASPEVPPENTVTKAWRLAKEYIDLPKLKVKLEKRIPSQAGLGGGSSDAAGFLRGLQRLTNRRFGAGEAMEVATAIGSDVPFFLVGGRAIGEGYGNQITPLQDRPESLIVIVMPQALVSTPSAYQALDQLPRKLVKPDDDAAHHNDFEFVAPDESRHVLEVLRSEADGPCGLCGSGASVYAFVSTQGRAESLQEILEQQALGRVFLSSTLSREASLLIS